MFYFTLPLWSPTIPTGLLESLDPKNIHGAVGILLMACLEVEIYVFKV